MTWWIVPPYRYGYMRPQQVYDGGGAVVESLLYRDDGLPYDLVYDSLDSNMAIGKRLALEGAY